MPATRARPGLAVTPSNCRAAVKLFFSEFKNIFPEIEITHIFPEIEKYIRKLSGPSTHTAYAPRKVFDSSFFHASCQFFYNKECGNVVLYHVFNVVVGLAALMCRSVVFK